MITVKNLTTGELVQVRDVKLENGKIIATWQRPEPGQRFMAANVAVVKTEETVHDDEHNVERRVLALADGYEIIEKAERKPAGERKPRTPRKPKPEAQPTAEPTAEDSSPVATDEPTDEPAPAEVYAEEIKYGFADAEALKNELYNKYGTMGADIFEAACKIAYATPAREAAAVNADDVKNIFNELLEQWAKVDGTKLRRITQRAANNGKDYFCADFDEICDYVADGQPVYLYGAAGCGKSHTAEQIAQRLGLDYYTQSQVLFAHDVKGYGDANGTYQETPFFKAFVNGGLFFIDEMDASAPEALVVLNTAIANRQYDFPIIGCVTAHPNFRIVAAGNTALTGADVEYTARSVQDASTINRFAFFEMQYEKNVELNIMAKGDKELYSFICDLRNAIKSAGVQLCVSYRQTAALATEKAVKYGRDKGLQRNVFGGRDKDEIRVIFGQLKNTDNIWAQAMAQLF